MVVFFTHEQGFTPVDELCIEHENDEQEVKLFADLRN
jgi:hypothetical protein